MFASRWLRLFHALPADKLAKQLVSFNFSVASFSFFHTIHMRAVKSDFNAACVRMLSVKLLPVTMCHTSSLRPKASAHYWLGVSMTLPSLYMM